MKTPKRRVDTGLLDVSRLQEKMDSGQVDFTHYDSDKDAFYLFVEKPNDDTSAHYINDSTALLYDPQSLKVVGMQVDSVRKK